MTPAERVYVEPFLGAGATWLRLLGSHLVPLVSWMGGKRRDADEHLALLGLRPGHPIPAILGDASWWGWVWPTVLDPVEGPEVSAMLRFWRERGDDPRELWFKLRGYGPLPSRPEAAAQLLWLQARAASGVPVWWGGPEYLAVAPGDGRERQRACERSRVLPAPEAALVQWASTRIDEAGQRQATEPKLLASDGRGDPREAGARTTRGERLIATTRGGQVPGAPFEAGHKGTDTRGGGGIVDPGTIIRHTDAWFLTEEWAPLLGDRARVYLDPPYLGATGYPAECHRAKVIDIARTWAEHGASVVLSEASPLADDLGGGWTSTQLRGAPKPEWVTCFGCDMRAILPALFRSVA